MRDIDIQKLRRFSLSFGLILFAYCLTGIEMDTPARISPFGLPLIIKRPNLLGWGLVMAAIYGSVRYFYFSSILKFSPRKRRKLLKSGRLIDESAFPSFPPGRNIDPFRSAIKKEITENFPNSNKIDVERVSSDGAFTLRIPKHVHLLSFIEDCDYFSPIWFNMISVALFVYTVLK